MIIKPLLINSRWPVNLGITHLPLNLAYAGAVLKNNDITFGALDLAVKDISDNAIFKKIESNDYNLIIINSENTVLQTRDFYYALKLALVIKHKFPKVKIVMTGAHVTFRDIETIDKYPEIDFILRYEIEFSLLELINCLKLNKNLENVKGLTFRGEDRIIRNPDAPPIGNLDDLPFPERRMFPIKEYLKKDKETIVQASRGCSNRCLFCQSSSMDRCLRFRNIDNVISEINEVLSIGFESVFFADLDFGIHKDRVIDFCSKIIKKKIPLRWSCNMRADRLTDSPETRQMLRLMKKSGCYRVFVGFESFSQDILNKIDKGVKPHTLRDSADILKEYGIGLHASFLFGLPGDTEETIKKTVEIAKEINPEMVSFNLLTPFPGTPLGETPEKYGITLDDREWYTNQFYNNKNVSGTINIDRERLGELAKWAYEEFLNQ